MLLSDYNNFVLLALFFTQWNGGE